MSTLGQESHSHTEENNNDDSDDLKECKDPLLAPKHVASTATAKEEDNFYKDEDPNIVRVFPIDYEKLITRLKNAKYFAAVASALAFVGGWMARPSLDDGDKNVVLMVAVLFAAVFVGMLLTESRNEQRIRGEHVAVTHHGIRRDVVDAENGVHTTTTIPWEQIRGVERRIHGTVCITMVNRRTRPIEIEGLYEPYDFVELVNSMKDNAEATHIVV